MGQRGGERDGAGGDSAPEGRSRATWTRFALLVALLVAGTAVALAVGLPDAPALRAQVDRAGAWAPPAFVVGYAVVTLLPFPKAVATVAAGLAFGFALALPLVLAGALAGAVLAFWLGRRLGRDAVERLTGGRLARVDAALRDRGLLAVVAARLVPVLPFTALNWGAGLSAVRTRDYVLGTAVGIVPGTVSYVALGAYGTGALTSAPVLVACALAAVLLVAVLRGRSRAAR